MCEDQIIARPTGIVDMVLDTDAYNEIDDQFAIAYALLSPEQVKVTALYAAPFLNEKSTGPKDGMEKSYNEILNVLRLAEREDLCSSVFRGSETYLPDENTPVLSDAASDLAERAMRYSPENPLYVVAIGAITNVASALLLQPQIRDRIVIVWLGGNTLAWKNTHEFNMMQDVAAARIVFGCGVRLVQLPCMGVVNIFTTTKPELEYWLVGKNRLADHLAKNAILEADSYALGKPWSRVIWDVTAVAWLVDRDGRFMQDRLIPSPIPSYDHYYSIDPTRHLIRCVSEINRDALMEDLFTKLLQ